MGFGSLMELERMDGMESMDGPYRFRPLRVLEHLQCKKCADTAAEQCLCWTLFSKIPLAAEVISDNNGVKATNP